MKKFQKENSVHMNEFHAVLRKTLSSNTVERREADSLLDDAAKSPDFVDHLLEALTEPECQIPSIACLKKICCTTVFSHQQHKIVLQLLNFIERDPKDSPLPATKPFLRLASSVVSLCMVALESSCTDENENTNTEDCLFLFNDSQNSLLKMFSRVFSTTTIGCSASTDDGGAHLSSTLSYLYLLLELVKDLSSSSFLYKSLSSSIIPMLLKCLLVPSLLENIRCDSLSEFFSLSTEILDEVYKKDVPQELQEPFIVFFSASSKIIFASSRTTVTNLSNDENALNRLLLLARFVADVFFHHQWCQSFIQIQIVTSIVNSFLDDVQFFNALATETYGADRGVIEQEECSLYSFVESHISCRWSFLSGMLIKKSLDKRILLEFFGKEEGENMKVLFNLILHYSFLSNTDAIRLTADANTFLKEEDDRVVELSITLRDHTANVCSILIRTLGPHFVTCALDSIASVLTADAQQSSAREREAALFLLFFVIEECRKKKILTFFVSNSSAFSPLLLSLTTTIIHRDATNGTSPLQVARALFLLPRVLSLLSMLQVDTSSIKREFATLCVATLPQLSFSSAQLLVKVSAIKCIFNFTPLCTLDELSLIFFTSFSSMSALLKDPHWTEDCLYVVLETMTRLLQAYRRRSTSRTKEQSTSSCLNTAGRKELTFLSGTCQSIMECWKLHVADPNIGELIRDVFKEFIQCSLPSPISRVDASFSSFMHWMGEMLQTKGEGRYIARTIIEMLMDLLQGCQFMEIYEEIIEVVLNPLVDLILSTDFASLLMQTLRCFARLLKECPISNVVTICAQIHLMQNCVGEETHATSRMIPSSVEGYGVYPVTTVVTAVVLRILGPSVSEAELLGVNCSLRVLIDKIQEFSHAETTQIAQAITTRLHEVRSTMVAQELLIPLSALFQHHTVALMDLWIKSNQVVGIFQIWMSQLPHFASVNDLVRSSQALLVSLQDETVRSLLSQKTLDNWVIPTSCHSCEKLKEKWLLTKKKLSSTKSSTLSAFPDRYVEHIPLDAAIFISIGKAILSIAQLWTVVEDSEIWGEEDSDEECSSIDEVDGLSDEDDDGDQDDDDGVEKKESEPSALTIKRREFALEMESCFRCLTTTELGTRYGAIASNVLTSTELSTINAFLSSL